MRCSTLPGQVPHRAARRRCSPSATVPEDRWPQAREWLDAHGYDDTLAYVRAMAIRVLEETGLLPHLNPGVMSWSDLQRLKPVAPSMGMMLETTSRRLFEEEGQAHFGSPDKDPAVRLRVLEDAGRVGIPFTTGILVGIGERRCRRGSTRSWPSGGSRASTARSRSASSRTSGPRTTRRCVRRRTWARRSTSPRLP